MCLINKIHTCEDFVSESLRMFFKQMTSRSRKALFILHNRKIKSLIFRIIKLFFHQNPLTKEMPFLQVYFLFIFLIFTEVCCYGWTLCLSFTSLHASMVCLEETRQILHNIQYNDEKVLHCSGTHFLLTTRVYLMRNTYTTHNKLGILWETQWISYIRCLFHVREFWEAIVLGW